MPVKILVDCMHNSGKISVSSSRRPDMSYSIATALCDLFQNQDGFSASMAEFGCRERYGSDSMRGRISVAENTAPDCYICIHSNPSGRTRDCGVALHIRQGDLKGERIAESVLNSISENTSLTPVGIYKSRGALFSEELATPVVAELLFNPYSSSYTRFCEGVRNLPEAVFSGIKQVFSGSKVEENSSFQEFLNENSRIGYMKVQVLAGRSEIPVKDARIVITKKINGDTFTLADVTSDVNGMTQRLSLPAPPAALSQTPGNVAPFAVYDIEITHPGYTPVNDLDVPVFENVLSIQNVKLNSISSENNGEV